MSQNSLVVANGAGSAVRAAINSALDTLATSDIGGSRPSGCQAGQFWINNTSPSGTVWSVYIFDGTHDIKLGELNSTSGNFTPFGAAASMLASPAFSGNPTASTPSQSDCSSKLATTSFFNQNFQAGFLNKFRNPQMAVAQRGTSGTVTTSTPLYTVDGWIVSCTGANITWAQSVSFVPSSHYLTLNGATSNTDILLKQRIESVDAAALAGKTVTIQVGFGNFSGGSITPKLTVKHAGSADNWSSPTTDVNAVNMQSVANSTNSFLAYTFACSSSANNGLEISIDFGAIGNGVWVNVSSADIRVSPGAPTGINVAPPPPELRPFAFELQWCQRFFSKSFAAATAPAQNAGANTGEAQWEYIRGAGSLTTHGFVNWPVPMQTTPTVTLYNPSATNAQARDETAGDCSSTATANLTSKGMTVSSTGNASSSTSNIIGLHWSATAEL